MLFLRKLVLLLPSRRRAREAALREELRSHLEMAADEAREQGLSAAEAAWAARRETGNTTWAAEQSRSVWTFAAIDRLAQDLRYGWRSLARSWTFTLVAVGSLAFGIGAATTIFSLVNSALLKPLPYDDPDRLVFAREIVQPLQHIYPTLPVNIHHLRFWQEHARSFESIAAIDSTSATFTGAGDPRVVSGALVSSNLFAVLRVAPEHGRSFLAEEEQPGRDHVIVITDAFWRRELHASPRSVGSTLLLDGTPHTIVGILPRSFQFPGGSDLGPLSALGARTDFFRPIGATLPSWAGEYDYLVFGRLRAGVSIAAASAELDVIERDIDREHQLKSGLRASVTPLQETIGAPVRTGLVVLLGAVLVLVVIVCVNLAGLMLARSSVRAREFSIRTALGAGRARLLQQVLTETAALSLAGAVLGVLGAAAGVGAFRASSPVHLPRLAEARVDGTVLLFATFLSVGCAVLFGLIPAWRIARSDPNEALRAGSRGVTHAPRALHLREWLVGTEVALSVVLLVFAGLLANSLVHVLRVDRGFTARQVVVAQVDLSPARYRAGADQSAYFDRALAALRVLPGVASAAYISQVPLTGESMVNDVQLEGADQSALDPVAHKLIEVNVRYVSPGYFDAVGIPLLRGRAIEDRDRGRDSTVVSERLAARLWPGQDPIGKRLTTGAGAGKLEVVGVVRDVHNAALDRPHTLVVYAPYWKRPLPFGALVVRPARDADSLMPVVGHAIRALDRGLPAPEMTTMDEIVASAVARRVFQMRLTAAFALSALLLAAMGIYGVISYTVTHRRNEIGIRMALGAGAAHVLVLVAGRGLRPVIAGLVAGVAAAAMLGHLIRSLLFGISSSDPLTIAAVSLTVIAISIVACVLPARTAIRTDVSRVLRFE